MIKLTKVDINKYKCVETQQGFDVDEHLTILVGMNESGKTSILEAIHKANPYDNSDDSSKYNITRDYPRKQKKKVDKSGEDPIAVKLYYSLDDELKNEIEKDLNIDITQKEFAVIYKYSGNRVWNPLKIDKRIFVENKLKQIGCYDEELVKKLVAIYDENEFTDFLEKEDNKESRVKELGEYYKNAPKWDNAIEEYVVRKYLEPNLPKYMYYDDYYSLPSRISLNDIKKADPLQPNEKTVKALLDLADVDVDKILASNDYEDFVAELEATQMIISDEIFNYWSTNNNLKIKFNIDKIEKKIKQNNVNNVNIVDHVLDIRVENQRSGVSLPLENRSKGFNWFFSFLVWFKRMQEDTESTYILLLDEPGLNLHAKAQRDLLKFLENLSTQYQIVYTTHSPFMVETEHLDRVRTVLEKEDGTHISDSIQEKDPNTLFPLQAALGYDIAQNLYVSKSNLLVEGISDLTYLIIVSAMLEEKGRKGLREDVTIVPTGGADKIATFVSLLRGNDLNIVCLLDTFKEQAAEARLKNLIKQNIINEKKIIYYHEILERTYADIEDLFSVDEYLSIYNGAMEKSITRDDIDDSKPILQQLSCFNHYRPANFLAKHVGEIELSSKTLENFEKLFEKLNKLF